MGSGKIHQQSTKFCTLTASWPPTSMVANHIFSKFINCSFPMADGYMKIHNLGNKPPLYIYIYNFKVKSKTFVNRRRQTYTHMQMFDRWTKGIWSFSHFLNVSTVRFNIKTVLACWIPINQLFSVRGQIRFILVLSIILRGNFRHWKAYYFFVSPN